MNLKSYSTFKPVKEFVALDMETVIGKSRAGTNLASIIIVPLYPRLQNVDI